MRRRGDRCLSHAARRCKRSSLQMASTIRLRRSNGCAMAEGKVRREVAHNTFGRPAILMARSASSI